MSDNPSRHYGTDEVVSVLVENSELAYEDSRAIIAAINAQTVVLTELLNYLKQSSTHIKQQPNNLPTQSVNSVNLQVLQQVERPSAKLQKALDWLAAHPDRVGETSRALADEIGVSHTTVAKAQHLVNL